MHRYESKGTVVMACAFVYACKGMTDCCKLCHKINIYTMSMLTQVVSLTLNLILIKYLQLLE